MTSASLRQPPLELLDLATGYQRAKILFLLVEFDLSTLLSGRRLTAEQIAHSLGMDVRAAESFLNACVALNLLELIDGAYRNSQLAETFLVAGKSTYLGDEFARYDRKSYPMWIDMSERLRQWRPGAGDDKIPDQVDQGPFGVRARHNLSMLVGNALADAYDFSRHNEMLDLGGGTGAISISVCKAHNRLTSTIVDLPPVAEVAREFVSDEGLSDRIKVLAGNFKKDDLTSGFDVALLANLLSVASEETNIRLFKRIYDRLPKRGAIILCGYILDDARVSPLIPVLFCLQDIGAQVPDVERDFATYSDWLKAAGFADLERKMFASPSSMIIAHKR